MLNFVDNVLLNYSWGNQLQENSLP
jgi:hypothetical protein